MECVKREGDKKRVPSIFYTNNPLFPYNSNLPDISASSNFFKSSLAKLTI